MPRKNCTIRKTKKASTARNFGATSGRMVLTQPSSRNSTYCGISVTWPGSIRVISIMANQKFRPLKRSRAKAKAAIEQAIRLPMTQVIEITSEFQKKVPKEMRRPFQPRK